MNSLAALDTRFLYTKFEELPIEDTCTWLGTEYVGSGTNAMLLPCGAPTIGAGIFCDPAHRFCAYHSVCERHKGTMPFWGEEVEYD